MITELFNRNLTTDIVIVAEIGVNHEGDPRRAELLVRQAIAAGADAVKLQSYTPWRYCAANDPARLERVTRFSLSADQHRHLRSVAESLGKPLFSTAVTEDWIPTLAELFPVLKIASGDLTFEPLIRAAANCGKPVILSTGLGSMAEIEQAVDWFTDEAGSATAERLVLMHCVSAYPTPIEQANIRSIPVLRNKFGLQVGYSNHVLGMEACLAAVALGARLLEVHFTDQKEGREFRDHALSMETADLVALRRSAEAVAASLGRDEKEVQPCESGNRPIVRKGVVAARDLPAGTVLTAEDLAYARPATEFASTEIGSVIGRSLQAGLKKGELVPRQGLR